MSIWQTPITLDKLHERNQGSMSDFLDIRFTEIGDYFLKATMPVQAKTHQAMGIMHGGASCVLAETVASVAANFVVDATKHYCVGLDINTNHIRPISTGYVEALAQPYHMGRSTQVWGIEIKSVETQKLISISRLTLAVVARSTDTS